MNKTDREGILFCVCGASGSGKSTHCRYLLEHNAETLSFSVSYTSRSPRAGEVDGENYFFVSRDDFEKKIEAGDLVEWEEVHGNYYGTSASTLNQAITEGKDLLLEVDIRGVLNLKRHFSSHTVVCFITPPSFSDLEKRILGRGAMDETELKTRLNTARNEYETVLNLAASDQVDYLLINDVQEETSHLLNSILIAERAKLKRFSLAFLEKFKA